MQIHGRIYVVPRPSGFVHQHLAPSVGIDTKNYVGSLSFFHLTTVRRGSAKPRDAQLSLYPSVSVMESIEHKHVEVRKTPAQVSPGGGKEMGGQRKYLSPRAGNLNLTQAFIKPISTAPILPDSCIQTGPKRFDFHFHGGIYGGNKGIGEGFLFLGYLRFHGRWKNYQRAPPRSQFSYGGSALKPKLEDQESELADARVWESCEGRQAKVAENTVVDKPKLQPFQVSQGHPSPLGATARDGGINFAFYSGNAEISKISFTDTNLMEKFSPDEGHYYDSSRIALDPYAMAVIRRGEFRKLGPDGNCWPQMAGTVLSFDDQKKQRQVHKEAQAAGERED
ncbi:hypothetical protein COP2_014282 [Malus domestica]